MTEKQKVVETLLVRSLDMLTDSQFVAYVALTSQGEETNDSPLCAYVAKRLDMIALYLTAEEAKDGACDARLRTRGDR